MPLTTYTKNYANSSGLNNGAMWVGGVVPVASTDSQALYNDSAATTGSCVIGASTTWGQILVTNTIGSLAISFSSSQTLTLTPTSYSNIGIDMAAALQNFTIAALTALGSSQTWTVAASRTLSVSGAISGTAKNLTLVGAGIKTFSGVSTGWTGSTVTVSAGQTNANTINALGAASNIVVVDSGANLTTSVAIVQTDIRVSGTGFTGGTGYGALLTTNALASTNVVKAMSNGTVITTTGLAAEIQADAGVTSLTLNIPGTNTNGTFSFASDYVVSNGVRLQSLASNGTTANTGRYDFGTTLGVTDANSSAGGGLGRSANAVIVEATGLVVYRGTTNFATATLNRNYTFLTNTATPTTPRAAVGIAAILDFAGPVTLTETTAGQAVIFSGAGAGELTGALKNLIKLSGTLTGDADLWVGRTKAGGLPLACSVGFGPAFDGTAWTGTLYPDSTVYYGTIGSNITFPVVYQSNININDINVVGTSAANHSSYASVATTQRVNIDAGAGGNLTLGGGNWTSAPTTWLVNAGTLTLNFSFNGTSGTLTKQGVSTLILTGNNTAFSAVVLSAGTLTLNSVGSAGPSAATFTISATSLLDSTTGATLTQNGANGLNANFTWGGSADLTFGTGALSWSTARTVTFVTAKTGTLKFLGNIGSLTSTSTLAVGGAPVGGSRSRLWLAGTNGMLAPTSTVTAGYFRVSNALGLGNASTTMWTVSSGAALEVDGSISPTSTRNVTITGPGPNTDGALRSVSGTNVWNGAIIPPVQSLASPTRIQVDEGTFTLTTAGGYTTISPTVSGTPLQFTALGATAILNQPRQLTANVSDVTINNGGVGKVVFSVANLHTGTMTCSAGTTKVTHINATSTGAVTVPASATLESTVQSQFQSTLSLGTLFSASRAILKFAA